MRGAWRGAHRIDDVVAGDLLGVSRSTGKGSIWIDDLTLEPMEPAGHLEMPEVRASTALPWHAPEAMFDRDLGAIWKSEGLPQTQSLTLLFRTGTEYGGLRIEWDEMDYACDYRVEGSDDGRDWRGLHAVTAGAGARDYVPIADGGSRLLGLRLLRSSRGKGYGIRNMTVLPYEFSTSPEQMFETIAQDAPRGCYPRYLYGEPARGRTRWLLDRTLSPPRRRTPHLERGRTATRAGEGLSPHPRGRAALCGPRPRDHRPRRRRRRD